MGYRQISKIFFIILALIGLPSLAAYYNLGGFWRATTVAATQIYRSVGPSKTTPLACGTAGGSCPGATGNLTISGTTATFASALPSNVGVGDTIVYDCTAGGGYTAADCIAFISGRTNSTIYTVQSSTGSAPTAFAANNTWQLYRSYTGLQNAFDGTENSGIVALNATLADFDSGPRDITTGATQGILNFAAYADATDTTAPGLNGYTTSSTYYIRIYTPYLSTEVGTSQRHQGYWNSGGYLLQTSSDGGLFIEDNFVRVDGLKIKLIDPVIYGGGLSIDNVGPNSKIYLSNNFVTMSGTGGGSNKGFSIGTQNDSTATFYVYNNIVSNALETGMYFAKGTAYAYNNTVYNSTLSGITSETSPTTVYAKNNISFASDPVSYYGYSINEGAGSDYNITNNGTTGGSNDIVVLSVLFVDPTNGDFRLTDTDVYARDNGIDLSADADLPFTNDASGTTRGGVWDRGALESAGGSRAIYRSVGTYSGVLQSGAGNNLTIAGTNATFASAIANDIGVGDAIQYDSDGGGSIDSIAFISGRYSSTSFKVQSTNGSTPTATSSADQDWAIYRSYTNLIDAENGDENTNISGNVRPFETWSGGANLTTNNWQWNIACYADTNDDDYQVVFGGWTTGPNNYLRIYTPYASTEVGTSQRHSGKWTTSGYRLNIVYDVAYPVAGAAINFSVKYVRFEGIQLRLEGTAGTGSAISFCNGVACSSGAGEYYFTENLIYTDYRNPSAGWEPVFDIWYSPTNTATKFYLANNIIYSMGADNAPVGIGVDSTIGNTYLYNNTVVTADVGIDNNRAGTVAINNIVQSSATDAYDGSAAFNATSNYNISDDTTDPGGANDINSASVTFVNATNYDYQLSSRDTVALGTGTNLTNDSLFPISKDVHTYTRYTPWDIGASVPVSAQEANSRFRSLGTNGSSLASGTNATLTVSNYTANFSSNLPNTVGMGDVLQYDTNSDGTIDTSDSLAFVKERISATTVMVERSNGTVPTSVTNGSGGVNWNIYRAYTSMAMALNGTENTSLDDDLENFDTLPKNLVTSNEQWNIVAYTGSDTVNASISTWTTNATYYLNIFSPRGPAFYESGQSYRHQGVRDTSLYELNYSTANTTSTLVINDDNVKVEGIQLRSGANNANKHIIHVGNSAGGVTATAEVQILNNILSSTWSANAHGTIFTGNASFLATNAKVKVYNNIMYSTGALGTGYMTSNGGTHYVYNNTTNGFAVGFNVSVLNASRATLKNNIAQGTSGNSYTCGSGCTAASNYNLGDDGTTAGTNAQTNKTVTFTDTSTFNYTLGSGDAAANNMGFNASDANITFNTDILGSNRPIGAAWEIGAHESYHATNSTYLASLTASSNNPSTFSATVTFIGDVNTNATFTLYYCNNTLSSNCDPLTGSSTVMTRSSGVSFATITGLVYPNYNLGDVLNLKAVASDGDGVVNSPLISTVTLLANIRYRSVGPGMTVAMVNGTSNLTISATNSLATFATALPDNIGVGDVVVYDCDSSTTLGGGDCTAFITVRNNSTSYIVRSNNATAPTAYGPAAVWKIFRAYTSLANANSGTENSGIVALNGTLANFDSGTYKNLTSNTYIRALAAYDDGIDTLGGDLVTSGYTTNGTYYLKVFTPYLPTEVGVTQRHTGSWFGPGYQLDTDGCYAYQPTSNYEVVEGIKFSKTNDCELGVVQYDSLNLKFIGNYVLYDGDSAASAATTGFMQSNVGLGPITVANNIFTGFKTWNGSGWRGHGIDNGFNNLNLYNNVSVNNNNGYNFDDGAIISAKNNIAQDTVTGYNANGESYGPNSDNNISDNATTVTNGTGNQSNITDVAFVNKVDLDFRLSASDIRAKDLGSNLSTDSNYSFSTDATGATRPQGSAWDIGAYEAGASSNKIALNRVTALQNDDTSFTVVGTYTGDEDNDSTATLYYCNSTDSGAGCDPEGGSSTGMTKSGNFFYASISNLANPNDPLDSFNVRVKVNDGDGYDSSTYKDTTVTLDATVIYRSVGTNASALATNAGNNLTIAGTTATFGATLPVNIGVGDAIQYDSDANGSIDRIAFIKKRNSATSYEVQATNGSAPTAKGTGDPNWGIYRAYIKLSDSLTGTENTGIDAAVRDFDPASQNLSTGNKSWFIACYADGDDTTLVNHGGGWTSAPNKRIKIFTPVTSTQVGTSQRHTGTWASGGYALRSNAGSYSTFLSGTRYIQVEGLRVEYSHTDDLNGLHFVTASAGATDIRVNNNIVRAPAGIGGIGIGADVGFTAPQTGAYFWNNIVYGFSGTGNSACIDMGEFNGVIANNTVTDCTYGISISGVTSTARLAVNNLIQNSTSQSVVDWSANNMFNDFFGYNIVSDTVATSHSATDKILTNATFNNAGANDYTLAAGDTAAKNTGVTYPTDLSRTSHKIIILDDIEGNSRPQGTRWSVGASDK